METACRRGGALALRPCDLDAEQCLIRLHEEGETVRWQPVSPALMAHLIAHAESPGRAWLGPAFAPVRKRSADQRPAARSAVLTNVCHVDEELAAQVGKDILTGQPVTTRLQEKRQHAGHLAGRKRNVTATANPPAQNA